MTSASQKLPVDLVAQETPLACDLSVFSAQGLEEHKSAFHSLWECKEAFQELDNGIRLQLPATAEMLATVFQFVANERLCCPFLDFTVEVRREQGPMYLSLTGRPGAKEVLLAGLESLG
jgi:hypothetical protein